MCGSRKYLSYLILIYTFSLFLIPATLALLSYLPFLAPVFYKLSSAYIPPGSTSLIFATLVLYKHLIPPVYKFQITPGSTPFTITLSDKALVYVVAADLLLLGFPGSLAPAACGWVLGNLVFFQVVPGKNWRIPTFGLGKRKSQGSEIEQSQQGQARNESQNQQLHENQN